MAASPCYANKVDMSCLPYYARLAAYAMIASASGLQGTAHGDVPLTRKEKLALRRAEAREQRALEEQAAERERQAEARSRSERERAADAERGAPPEPSRSFRLPQSLLPDLLAVWELLQILAPILQVTNGLFSIICAAWQQVH